MKQKLEILTDEEIAVIQAALFFIQGKDGMTKKAQEVHARLLERYNMDSRVLSMKVWN